MRVVEGKSMSVIQAISAAYYTSMAHNAAFAMIMNNQARMSMARNAGNIPFGSNMQALAAMDNRLAMDNLNNSLRYKIANTMLENQRNAKKKSSGLNLLA